MKSSQKKMMKKMAAIYLSLFMVFSMMTSSTLNPVHAEEDVNDEKITEVEAAPVTEEEPAQEVKGEEPKPEATPESVVVEETPTVEEVAQTNNEEVKPEESNDDSTVTPAVEEEKQEEEKTDAKVPAAKEEQPKSVKKAPALSETRNGSDETNEPTVILTLGKSAGGKVKLSTTKDGASVEPNEEDADGYYNIPTGADIKLTPVPESGYRFVGWYENSDKQTEYATGGSTDSSITLNADRALSVYAYFEKAITLTFIGSAIDGENVAANYSVTVQSGSGLDGINFNQRRAILAHFTTEQYSPYDGGNFFYAIKNPLSAYSNWKEVRDEDYYNHNDHPTVDTTYYLAVQKVVDQIDITIDKPLCGTNVRLEQVPSIVSEGQPTLTFNDAVEAQQNQDNYPSAYYMQDAQTVLNGTIKGGETYKVFAAIKTKFGYIFDSNKTPTIKANNGIENSYTFTRDSSGQARLTFDIEAEHEWGEWRVTKPATEEEEGEETRQCKHCDETETRPIRKLGYKQLTIHWESIDGTDLIAPKVYEFKAGLTAAEVVEPKLDELKNYFKKDGYIRARTVVYPVTFITWNQAKAIYPDSPTSAFAENSYKNDDPLTEDTDMYFIMLKVADMGTVTFTPPSCKDTTTNSGKAGDWTSVTNKPQVSYSPVEGVRRGAADPIWVTGVDENTLYSGSLGGERVFRITFDTKTGYYFTTDSKLTLEGAELKRNKSEGPGTVTVTVFGLSKSTHEWGEWKVTTEPTYTEEGVETRKCKHCNETETRPIPKLEYKKLTIHWTSVDGEDLVAPKVYDFEAGQTAQEVIEPKLNELKAHFQKDGYIPARTTTYIVSGITWRQAIQRTPGYPSNALDRANYIKHGAMNDDTDLYYVMLKVVDKIPVSFTAPSCAYETTNTGDWTSVTNKPQVTFAGAEGVNGGVNNPIWVTAVGQSTLYSGSLAGDRTFRITFNTQPGYYFTTDTEITIDGAELKKHSLDDSGTVTVSVWANSHSEHEWGEWEVTKEPTVDEEGVETRRCNICNKEETRPIPKKGFYRLTIHWESIDGADLMEPKVYVFEEGQSAREVVEPKLDELKSYFKKDGYIRARTPDYPVTFITWNQAIAIYPKFPTTAFAENSYKNDDPLTEDTDMYFIMLKVAHIGTVTFTPPLCNEVTTNTGSMESVTNKPQATFVAGAGVKSEVAYPIWTTGVRQSDLYAGSLNGKHIFRIGFGTETGYYFTKDSEFTLEGAELKHDNREDPGTVSFSAWGESISDHDWGEWQIVKEPTYTETGLRGRVCKHDSSHVQEEEIPMLEYKKLTVHWTSIDGEDLMNSKVYKFEAGQTAEEVLDSERIDELIAHFQKAGYVREKTDVYPVTSISWDEAITINPDSPTTALSAASYKNYGPMDDDTSLFFVMNKVVDKVTATLTPPSCADETSNEGTKDSVTNKPQVTFGSGEGVESEIVEPVWVTGAQATDLYSGSLEGEKQLWFKLKASAGYVFTTDTEVTLDGADSVDYLASDDEGTPELGVWATTTADHDWDEPVYEWAPDNSEVRARRYCKNDKNHYEQELVQTAEEITRPATCEEMGETTYTATFDSDIFETQTKTVENIDALGHDFGEWEIVKEPTESETGLRRRVCKNDPTHVEEEEIPMLDPEIYTLIFEFDGGEINGSTEPIVFKYRKGDYIIIPDAPTREGYEFLYWEGSKYYPGDKYYVVENHKFVAKWKKAEDKKNAPTPTSTPSNKSKGVPNTSDQININGWMMLLIASLFGVGYSLKLKRRRG